MASRSATTPVRTRRGLGVPRPEAVRFATSSRSRSTRSTRRRGAIGELQSLRVWRQRYLRRPAGSRPTTSQIVADSRSWKMIDGLNDELVVAGGDRSRSTTTAARGSAVRAHDDRWRRPRPAAPTTCQSTCAFRDGHDHGRAVQRAGVPVVRDLMVDRSAFDRISSRWLHHRPDAAAPKANAVSPKPGGEPAIDAAICIGCGACVAACPNASAMLFTAAKVAHLAHLPQGQPNALHASPAWSGDAIAGLRRLHQRRRMRGGLPEGIRASTIARSTATIWPLSSRVAAMSRLMTLFRAPRESGPRARSRGYCRAWRRPGRRIRSPRRVRHRRRVIDGLEQRQAARVGTPVGTDAGSSDADQPPFARRRRRVGAFDRHGGAAAIPASRRARQSSGGATASPGRGR